MGGGGLLTPVGGPSPTEFQLFSTKLNSSPNQTRRLGTAFCASMVLAATATCVLWWRSAANSKGTR
jgi:hypothetical protein